VFVKVFDAPLEELGEGQSGEHQDQHHAQQAPDGYDYAAPRPWLLPQRFIRPSSASYLESANKKRLTTTVRVTLKRTLTTNQKRHPLPIASRGLPYSRSRPRGNLPLEEDLFQDRFQVAHDLLLSFGV
jgi:hypothetical protein